MKVMRKKSIGKVLCAALLAVVMALPMGFMAPEHAAAANRITLSDFSVSFMRTNGYYNSADFTMAEASVDGSGNQVFTINNTGSPYSTSGEYAYDAETLTPQSLYPRIHFTMDTASSVSIYNPQTGNYDILKYPADSGWWLIERLHITVKPYNTDPNYVIANFALYETGQPGSGNETVFTIKMKKWEKQFEPEYTPLFFSKNSGLFVGKRESNGNWGSDLLQLNATDFSAVSGVPYLYEYLLPGNVTFPYPRDIEGILPALTTVKVNNAAVPGSGNLLTGSVTFTAAKPWVDISLEKITAGMPNSDLKKTINVPTVWRIRVNGKDGSGTGGSGGGTSPSTEGTFKDNSGKTVTVSIAGIPDSAWTGKQVKPVPTVTVSGQKLAKGTDYTIAYGANKYIGKGTLMIKGAGKYKGSIAVPFRIVPKAPTGVKLTAATKSLKVKWTKPAKFKSQQITGYEVQYCYKDGSKWTAWNTKSFKVSYKAKAKTVTKTLKNLKAKKNYQVQVRAYKKVSGTNYYSAWTKVKAKKTK